MEQLQRMAKLGAGIYIDGELAGEIGLARISEPIIAGNNEYRACVWLGLGLFARWHYPVLINAKYNDEATSIVFDLANKSKGRITLLSGDEKKHFLAEEYKPMDVKEMRVKADELIKEGYDILLQRISLQR